MLFPIVTGKSGEDLNKEQAGLGIGEGVAQWHPDTPSSDHPFPSLDPPPGDSSGLGQETHWRPGGLRRDKSQRFGGGGCWWGKGLGQK